MYITITCKIIFNIYKNKFNVKSRKLLKYLRMIKDDG